jgi:hypothetical protein
MSGLLVVSRTNVHFDPLGQPALVTRLHAAEHTPTLASSDQWP